MDIVDIKARLIDHIGNIDLAKLTIAELREYCGLVKDAEGLTKADKWDSMASALHNMCYGFSRPAPVKEG